MRFNNPDHLSWFTGNSFIADTVRAIVRRPRNEAKRSDRSSGGCELLLNHREGSAPFQPGLVHLSWVLHAFGPKVFIKIIG